MTYDGTFTLQYSAEVLSNNTTPDLQGKKNPCPTNTPQNCDQLQNIAYGLILKKLMQNEYLISLWSAKIISGTKKRFIQLTLLSDTESQAVAADYEQPLAGGNFRKGDKRN